MSLRDKPYLPLYVQDFMTDEKLSECSASTTGVYIRLMCLMHKSEDYGKILLKQKDKQTDQQIKNFAIKIAKQMPYSDEVILHGLTELLEENVLKIEGDYLIQGRMVYDNHISQVRSESGSKGGEQTGKIFAKAKTKAKPKAKKPAKPDIDIKDDNVINNSLKLCIGFWKNELHPDWTFEDIHGKKMKSIIDKIKQIMVKGSKEVTATSIFDSFTFICKKLPDWYKNKDLAIIDSKFNEIIEEIKNGKSTNRIDKTRSAAEQAVHNIIAAGGLDPAQP